MLKNQNNVENLVKQIDNLSYNEKLDVYNRSFSIGCFVSKDINDRLILLSLISLTYFQLKKKDPNIKPIEILCKITNTKNDNSIFYQALESLSIIVEDFGYDCTKADSCGLKTSNEIINKIKEILNTWSPF